MSHFLFGRTLFALNAHPPPGRGAWAAFTLGSLFPDVDVLLIPFGFDIYLDWHEKGTHSLSGALVCAAVLAAGLRASLADSRIAVLLMAAAAGTLGHLFWDLASGGGLRLLAPFADHRFGFQLVAMGEPIVLGLLVLPLLLRSWRGRSGAIGTIVALALVLLLKCLSREMAMTAWRRAAVPGPHPRQAIHLAARRASFGNWLLYEREGDRLRCLRVDAWNGAIDNWLEREAPDSDAAVVASAQLGVVRRLRRVAVVPVAWHEHDGIHPQVFWADFTTCDASACPVAFGVTFDEGLRPIQEVIRVGPLVWNRATGLPAH